LFKIHFPTISQFAALLMLNISNAVFQLLVIPILIHYATPIKLGVYFIALSFGVLASILVNFGSSQTAVVELQRASTDNEKNMISAETLAVRFYPLWIAVCISLGVAAVSDNGIYYVAILPMLFAELINPQFYLIAQYKINKYSILNMVIRALVLGLIYVFRNNDQLIFIALFSSGVGMFLLNALFFKVAFPAANLFSLWPNFKRILALIKTHALIVGNGITVHLQQSLFLFALPAFASPIFLSAYGLIDKLISSCRMMVNAYSAAVMPKAAGEHLQGNEQWRTLKKQQNSILALACIAAGFVLYFFPVFILSLLLLGKSNVDPAFMLEATRLLKLIALVPLLIALNVFNVAELILDKKFKSYFGAGLIVLLIAGLFILFLYLGLPNYTLGYYPMIIEGACLVIYFLIIQSNRSNG
jgi:O-antigen/teichoic acid export membrane protein